MNDLSLYKKKQILQASLEQQGIRASTKAKWRLSFTLHPNTWLITNLQLWLLLMPVYLAETIISNNQKFMLYLQHFTCSHIPFSVPSCLFFFKPNSDLTYAGESFDLVFSGGFNLQCRNGLKEELNTTVPTHLISLAQCIFRATLKHLNLHTKESKLHSTGQTPSIPSSRAWHITWKMSGGGD